MLFWMTAGFLLPQHSFASTGTAGASFLDIPVGAGPAAMGSAYTALAADAYAPIWNPAGLGWLDGVQVAAQHVSYLESMNYEFASVVTPVKKGALGFSVQYLGSGDIDGTLPDGSSIGTFSSHFAAYTASYGLKWGDSFSIGASGKIINEKISEVSATAYGGDVGALYKVTPHLSLATTVTNFGSRLTFTDQGDTLPLAWHVAGAYALNPQWDATAEGVYAEGRETGRVGLQWRPVEAVALRTGYRSDTTKELSALAGFSTGVGIHLWGQEFAYAWLPYGDLGDTQYFSLLLHFGATANERRNLIQFQTIKSPHVAGATLTGEGDYEQLLQLLTDHAEQKTAYAVGERRP